MTIINYRRLHLAFNKYANGNKCKIELRLNEWINDQNKIRSHLNSEMYAYVLNTFKFYFYDKKKNQILFTWTRPSGLNTTIFAFVHRPRSGGRQCETEEYFNV